MRHSRFWVFCLVLLAVTALAAFGQHQAINLETRVIESFNNTEDGLYTWRKDASHFSVGKSSDDSNHPAFASLGLEEGEFFPRLNYFDVWPQALHRNNPEGREIRSMGIWGKFKRGGFNWIDIYPTLKSEGEDGRAFEIPLPGRVRFLDMWVWSSGLNYYIEAYIRDQQGIVHVVPMGNLNHTGWRNLRVPIPNNVRQQRRIFLETRAAGTLTAADRNTVYLRFVKFRIWTRPGERVDDFYIYLNQFRILTDTFESVFDGDEMFDPEWVRDNWDPGNTGN